MELPSKLLSQAVLEMAKLPGIGDKTALRLVLQLLKQEKSEALRLSNALNELINKINYCKICHNITENEVCDICSNTSRDNSTICVVEDIRDLLAIENTRQYNGLYHILNGIISPMDGIGPTDITIDLLINRVKTETVNEVILALPTTMEGDTTNFYINKQVSKYVAKVTTLARGLSFGDELKYADELTLGRSLLERVQYKVS